MQDFDVLIIGAGIIGASIFNQLTRAGYRVGLLEKNQAASACTGYSSGIMRCFHMDSASSNRALVSMQDYVNLSNESDEPVTIKQIGFLYLPTDAQQHQARLEAKRLSGYTPIEWLTKSDIQERFGYAFNSLPNYAVYEPNAGYICPKAVTKMWIRYGEMFGGVLYENTPVQQINKTQRNKIYITTLNADMSAKKLVIAAGAATPLLLDKLGVSHDLYVKHIQLDIRSINRHIAHPAFIDENTQLYGRSDLATNSMHIGLPTQNLSDAEHSELIYQKGMQCFSWVKESKLENKLSSADCYSKSGRALVSPIENDNSIFVASGFGGGGFKMAAWAGHEITRLIQL